MLPSSVLRHVAKAGNEHDWKGDSIEKVREEAIQTGAMSARFLMNLKEGKKT